METKKKRGCNYTAVEKEMLLNLIKKHQHIIENKETNSQMILKKREAWNLVCQQYNAVAVSDVRKWDQLRHLYENLKQRFKKNIAKINKVRYLENIQDLRKRASNDKKKNCHTGGGAYKSTLMEQDAQILAMVALQIQPYDANQYDDAALYFADVEVHNIYNNKDEASEFIIIDTDKTDDQYTTILPYPKIVSPAR